MKSPSGGRPWGGIIRRYRDFLPMLDERNLVTLHEGNTPLVECPRLAALAGGSIRLFAKIEGMNPTGSFKDRGMTVAISRALDEGAKAVICASTGNTSASAAAYAARANLKAYVLIPRGNIALGKLSQAMMHGATVAEIEGNFDQALSLVKKASAEFPVKLVNSLNPDRIEGQKTAAFEICDALGGAPRYHFLPVGNAGNITAIWKGYKEYKEAGHIDSLPRMMGFQAAGAAPIVLGRPVDNPETVATAIRIGNPASWEGALRAKEESGGTIESVTDEEILSAYSFMATQEGIFCEPASAASVAGVLKKCREGLFQKGDSVVCTLTGHGMKDPDRAVSFAPKPIQIAAEIGALIRLFGS
jgi:threonine synthase